MDHPHADAPPLPARRPRLLGRDREVHEVLAAVDAAAQAVVTVTGTGGSGKTALALEVCHRLTVQFGRRWFVDLTRVEHPDDVAVHVSHRLGLRPGRLDPDQVLVDELRRGPALLVLDNCEHVLDAVAELVGHLTAGCPELTVLATSRRPLDVPAERTVPLAPLSVTRPDGSPGAAVDLLVERARAAGADVVVDPRTTPALIEICRRLDGLPLPVVLVAHRLRGAGPAEVAEQLATDLTLPSLRGGAVHQRTMTASLDWSLDLLTAPERDLLLRAGVFVGTFDAEDCRAVCLPDAAPAAARDLLARLVDHSLLVADTTTDPTRYHLLAVVREHVRRRTGPALHAETVAAHRRHLVGTVGVAARTTPFFTQIDVRRIEIMHDDAVAALDRAVDDGDTTAVVHLLMALMRFWRVTGRIRFGVERIAASTPGLDGVELALVRLIRADLERVLGLLDDAEEHARAALATIRSAGPALAPALPTATGILGTVLADRGRYDQARDLFTEVFGLYDPAEDRRLHAVWCATLGDIELRAGRHDAARTLLLEARDVFSGQHDQPQVWLAGRVHGQLGVLARHRGELAEARELLVTGLDELAAYGALAEAAPLVEELAEILAATRREGDAAECRRAAAGMRRQVGSPHAGDDDGDEGDEVSLGIAAVVRLVRDGAAPAGDEVLTPREDEVAELVAEGLTNPQIAARLVISPGTARTHVERIRTKLGVSTRVQVARWVMDRYVDRRTR